MCKHKICRALVFWSVLWLIIAGTVTASVTVSWWHVWDGSRIPLVEHMIEDFEAKHPGIKVESIVISQGGMNERYLQAIAGGAPPDVIMINAQGLKSLADKGALIPLDNLITRDPEGLVPEDIFYPAEVNLHRWEGKQFGLPGATAGVRSLLWCNADMFADAGLPAQPPVTWQELAGCAEKLHEVDSDGTVTRIGFVPFWRGFLDWLYSNNGRFLTDDGKKLIFESPEGVEALTWIVDYVEKFGGFNVLQSALSGGGIRAAFYNGQLAIYWDGVWMFYQLKTEAPHIDYFVSRFPYNAANPDARPVEPVGAAFGWSYAIPKGAKHVEEAWEWIKYITYKEGNRYFFTQQSRSSPARATNSDPSFATNPYWLLVGAILSEGVVVPVLPISSQLYGELNSRVEKTLRGELSPKVALAEARRVGQAILDEFWSAR